ncbi:JNK [Symbiodinium sp. CCMP2592]|nr:JNK [Symbiodinium sp. CCMP2592]
MTASSFGDFAFACAASFDMACPSVKRKTVSFGNTETRVIESSFPEPAFGPVNRERNLSYSWPENIRGLNSARERRRAHMKAVLWREQVLLDDIDAKTLGNDACVLELTLSQRSACEVFAAAVKSIKRVRRLMLDSGCGIDLIGLGDLSREERDLIVQNAKISLRTANGKTNTKGVAHMRIDGLDELIEAYVLESTPSLLSLGKRCKELGYRFIWEPFCDPIFFDPKGKRLKVDVINNIPYLAPSETEVVAGRPDLPRVYPALPAPIIVHEKVVAAGEEPGSELNAVGELDLDMPNAKSVQKSAPDDNKKVPDKGKPQSPPDEPRARDLKDEAKSIRHLMTHLPKNPYCDACQRAKMENVKSFRQDSPRDKGFEKFGEHVTIDTMVLHGLGNRGNIGETDAVVFYDLATEWLESVPVKGRTNADTLRAFQQVFGDLRDVNSCSIDVERRYAPSAIREIYCDKAREFISTCKKVGISVKHSTPGMPRTNAIAESKVKLVLHGARVALRQAGLSAKFWPYACKHFCHARNIELREGQSAYAMRFDGVEFDGQILPFGCLVDFHPTPARKQTRRSQRDEVVLGDGEEYAVPGAEVDQRLSSYQRPSKFSPTSKPGIFLGCHFENGGKWDGDYIVADLEDFKRDALRASVHQVKKIYCSPKERWTFPMLAVYDKQTRSMCINDPAMQSCAPQSSERLDASDMLELEDIDEMFALDEPTRMTEEDVRRAREAELRAESSHGGGVDYWEYDPSSHKWTYHVVVPRKAMIHPSKTPGSLGESPDPWKLSTVRISHVQYKDKSPVTIYETGYAFGKTRLMQLWTGTVEFYDDGFAPSKKKLPPYHGSEILEGEGGLPYRQSVPRSERVYRGSRKPNSIDSESWRSMNRAEREGYVEAERREAESHAMSREDSRDAAPVDIAFDSEYESGAERHDKDYWYHDVAAGTVTRFHVIERRARFNPTSVKDCPVDPATLTDVRMTMAMTDGTEFTLQDSWRSSDVRSLPCRWTGKTVFVIGSSAKTQIKVRTSLPNNDGTERRVQTANGYYGHALRAKGRVVVPAKSRACVVTDLEFDPPSGMSARLQPLRGSGLDICPAMYTYNEGATHSGVDVLNPTDTDLIVEPGQDVAVVQFYTSVLAAVELDFTDEDTGDGTSAPVEPSNDCLDTDAAPAMSIRSDPHSHRSPDSSVFFYSACVARPVDRKEREPKKAFPELTFGDRDTTVAQGSAGPREIRMIKYDMRSFMEPCVSRYVELCGPKYKATLRSADTPFLDESRPEFDTNPDRPEVNRLLGHPTDTPIPPGKGVLGDCAAAVLMKILYGARMGRYDLIRPVQALASLITKWDGLCDKKLHRLVCYINSTLDLNLYGWIGDAPEMLELVLYCDADLAGDRTDSKSTSGVFMCLLGPRSFMPLNALSKKQTSVSKSTPEAEIVSLDHAVYKLGLPALSMWEYMLGRRFRLRVMEDNEAAIRVIITGHNPNMRHMSRTQRIDISALNERYHAGDFLFVTCPSQFEAGDILTKACTDAKVWGRNLMSIGHFRKGTLISSGMLSDDANMGADEAPVPIQTPRDESTGGGKRSEDVPIGLRMKAMMLKIGVQEIPQASIWQRLEQLACNSGFDLKLHQLVDSFLLSNHPLADKQRKQYPREFMDFIDRYRVMCALAFSRVATLSGDAAGVREKMDLTMALARHCMHFQAQTFKGSRETLSNDTLRLMGTCYIPSPLASWNRNLMGYSSSSAEQRWLRTDTSIKHNDLTKLSPIELSRDVVNPAEAARFFKGFLQLRPTLSFIPGAFLAIKALNRFPTLNSLKEQASHLENDRKEHGYDLPAVDANGIGEVAAFRNEDDDENNPLMHGWASFMNTMAEAYPGRCVSIDDTLNWGASTQMTYEDGASQITIRPTDGWVYVPAMNSDIYDPQETYLHGTNLRYLWSILAHGGLFGEDYVTDDHGSHEPCVWVTGHAPEAAGSYASGTYLGGGYWFQVMICVSRTMVNSHSRTTKKLGGSQKQIRVGTRFLELCGIAFRPFRLLDDREQGVSTSPNYVIHGHRFLSADGTKAVAWHPWMEASPIDPRILKLLGDSVARDNVEFADLTIQGGNTTQQAASTETEQPVATAADDHAAASGGEATERITVNPVVLRRNHWMPDSYGTSEQATVGGRYALLSELQSSSYRIELAPFFQSRAPMLGEEGSQGLPKPTKLETIAGGPSKEWEAWCRHYRKAYGALLGNFGYTSAKNIKGIVYDEENTTDIIGALIWSPADALVAVSIHGIRTVTTMASTIAFGGAPPTIKPAVPSKPQRFVVMHDGLLTFRSAKSWHAGEMNTHLKNALASFGFPESEVRVQAFDEGEKLKEMVDTLELMRSDPSVPPSNVHILILWKGDELWKMDQGWNKLTGDIDMARSQYAKVTARDALEKYNTIYGSVSLCGPVSPSMGFLPTLPGPLFEKYREEMRSIWDEIRRSNFLSLSFDAILEGLPYLKGYHIMHESKTIGVLCTRICSMFTLAALARFPSYATRREYQIAHDKMWARTPVPEERSTGTVKAIVHSTTVDMSQLGFDDEDEEEMADDAGPAAPENPIKQEQTSLADLPGIRHPDPIELPATPVHGQAMPVSPGLAPAAANDEESSDSSDGDGQQGDGDAAMPAVKKEESDEEFNELLEGMTEAFENLPTPRDAERTVAANRDAARPPAVPAIPLSAMKKPKPFSGVEAAGPTAEGRQGYAHFESQVSEAEARCEQAAKMKAHIAEVAKGATGVENAEHLRSIADGLARVMDPNINDDSVFQGAMYPPGDYALDAVTNRLAQGRRRVESNSNLIREMASDRFTPVLINRDTGETVSAIDARWTPEYGNRGELEAKVGAIISNLDAVVASMSTLPVFHPHIPSTYGMARSLLNTYQSLQIAIRHRGMGAMSFEQMVFKPEDLEVPTPDDWPDLIAPTPGKVIQSMRVALVNNTAARLTREDLKLPPGFAMQRRVTEFRKPEEDPAQSLMGLTDDLSYGTTGRSGDDRLSQFQRSMAVQLRNTAGFLASEFQKHARSIAASSSRRSDASGALSSQGDGAADNDLPSTEQVSVASERAIAPPPPNVAPPPPPTAAAPPRASEESAKEDDDDTKMDDDTAGQKPEQKPEEDADMGSGKELQDEPPEHGLRSSPPNDMVAQGAALSGARGPDIDIDPASTTADQAANDARNFRIEGPGIKATTIHRPDQMPERGVDSIAPIVQYETTSVPIALTDFVVPGLDMGIDDSVHGRLVSATCLPPTDEQRKYSRRRFAMLSSNQTVYLNVALHKKPVKGDHDSFLRPESYEDCREIHDAVRAYNAKEAKFRSVGGTSVSCSRLLIDDAQNIPAARIPDAGMINLVRKLLFRVLTQTKEYPSATAERTQNRPQDQERGIPLYSRFDQSGIIAFDVIPMYMEREREYMKANAGENDGRILLQTSILDERGEPTEITTRCIMEIARTDNNRMFEFFYSTIDNDGSPQFVGIRATYGFGPDNFNRFRLLTKCQHGPFIQLAQDHYVAGERKRNVARYHPQYGGGCATIREFFGYMSDCKLNPPKGRLFLTLLPYAPGSGNNNEWEEVYMNVRMNPGRETLSNTASSQSMLPEGMGSNRMIVFAIDLHMIAAGINPIVFHPRGYYAIKDSIPLACMPIAYFMDTGSLVFNTAFKYVGGPKFGTGPKRGDHKRETWPLASFDCPMCGASFPVGLHMFHSCTKPIHYPDGMFYADPVNPFQVEYYGSHAEWLNELIERNELKEFRLHEYRAIKQLRNFPVSRSIAEDHRQTAFFGVPPIKCTAADTSPKEVELFKKSVRGTIQGAIRLDISIERLVAGITGKEARSGVEDFLNSQSIACATTIVKHFGAVFATCREKPLCYYARWSIHCQRAYRVCLSRGYLSPFYTGGTIDYTVDSDMVEKIRLAHLPLQNANLAMRRQIRLSTEFGTLDEFRATITDTQKYQRYMRVDSESLSALLAKVTLTTCYGIPMKGEPGYISDDEAEEIEGTAAATEKPKGKGKGEEEEPDVQAINWRDLDPLGRKFIPHHTDSRFTIFADGNTALLDAPETPDEKRKEFKEFIRDHSVKIKECFDDDRATEKTFFNLVEGVKDQLPDTKRTDPVLMKKNEDVFEALPDELEEPQDLFDVAAQRARRRADAPQRRVQATEQRHASIPEAHAVPVPPDDEDEDDTELERAIRPGPKSQRTGREHLGGVAPETNPPPPREMPPPSNPPSRKTSRQSGYNVPHAEGETLMVSGRAPYSDQKGLPLVLRMKTRVPEPDLDNPTIEDIIRMYHAPNTLPVVRKKVANVIISMNANPDDPINMKAAGVVPPSAEETGAGRAASPGGTSATTQERINPKFPAPNTRTASNPPSKSARDEKWAPSIVRPTPGRVITSAEARGRTQQPTISHDGPGQGNNGKGQIPNWLKRDRPHR